MFLRRHILQCFEKMIKINALNSKQSQQSRRVGNVKRVQRIRTKQCSVSGKSTELLEWMHVDWVLNWFYDDLVITGIVNYSAELQPFKTYRSIFREMVRIFVPHWDLFWSKSQSTSTTSLWSSQIDHHSQPLNDHDQFILHASCCTINLDLFAVWSDS